MKKSFRLIFFLLLSFLPICMYGSGKIYDVTKFGAKGDEKTVNTKIFQKVIDDCSKNGGGVVLVPKGKYITGTILLKDNVIISLEDSAFLIGSTDINEYQMVDPFRTGNGAPMGYCFIGAVDAKNVGIVGKGCIDGRGKEVLAINGKEKRPFLVRFVRSTGISLEGIHLMNSAAWTCHFFACRTIDIHNVSINSRGLGNNDGFDIDCSQDIRISACNIDTGDDGLCFKTTWSRMACKDITITGLKITSNHSGIKFGTESMAPFENIKISDCYIYDTNNGGIKINSVDGAQIRNIEISDITMNNVRTPMLFRLGSRLNVFRKESDTKQATGCIENITICNVKAKAAKAAQIKPPSGILITGVPGYPIKNLTLENIEIILAGGGTIEHSRQVVPEAESEYPEVKTFGPTIPAYGIWARHVAGLNLKNITLQIDSADLRPAFIVDDGKMVTIENSQIAVSTGMPAVIRLENVTGALIRGNTANGKAKAFVSLQGGATWGIKLAENKTNGIEKIADLSKEVKSDAIPPDTISCRTAPQLLPGRGLSQYDFFYAGEQKNRNMYLVRNGKVEWSYIDTAGRGEISDAVLMSNGNVVFAHQHGVTVISKEKQVLWKYDCPAGNEIHTAQPIGKKYVVFIQNADTAKVRLVNIKTGKFVKEFPIPVGDAKRAHGQFRHARLTEEGTYLVAHMDMNKINEYDFNGKILNSIDFPSPWSAVKLKNGNILAVCNRNIVREITNAGQLVWEIKPDDLPEYTFFGIQTAYRLPNGNTVINNWYNQWKKVYMDPSNLPVQFLEVTPDKKVVWALKAWETPLNLGPSTIIQFLGTNAKAEDCHFGPIH